MFRPRYRSLPLLLALLHAGAASATNPASGTLTPTTEAIAADGGPYLVSNPSGVATGSPVCDGAGAACDEFLLTVELPESFRNANPNLAIRVALDTASPSGADDLDLYIRDAATGELIGSAATGTASEVATVPVSSLPASVRIEIVPFAVSGATTTLTITYQQQAGGGGGADPCTIDGTASNGASVDPRLAQELAALPATAVHGAFVQFSSGTIKQQNALLDSLGMTRVQDFRRYARSVYARGPVAAFAALARSPLVVRLEHNRQLRYFGDTANWATGVRVAQEPVAGGPYYDAQRKVLTGSGITLGVIDGGLYGAHPDFAGRILHNYRLVDFATGVAPEYVDVGEGDSEAPAGGHGTHVNGIMAGSGAASDGGYPVEAAAPNRRGTYTGVAPEANIINYGHGAGLLVLSAVNAYQHILDNADGFDPPLRAVNNSYGDIEPGTPYNPSSTDACLVKAMVQEKNIVMVFAAGNDGGDGSADRTSSYCKDQTPGVICVANYDDQGTGDRDAPLATSSSRGKQGDPLNYPDISAPGYLITATCVQGTPTQPICTGGDDNPAETDWQPWYGTISGTSMASPHVTGAIGLLLQARPDLTPGDIERIIQRSARKVGGGYEADPQLSGNTVHFAYGAGLLDIPAALETLGVAKAGTSAPGAEWTVFDGDVDALITEGAADIVGLTAQETLVDGVSGINWRLKLAAAEDFALSPALAYRLEYNVAGERAVTTLVATAAGVEVPEAGVGNNAVATAVSRDGDTVQAFVPYSALGYPGVNDPIHNIRVVVSNDGAALDYAPSPADTPAAIAAVQPMFGRSFSVQLPAGAPPPSSERSCLLPGLTLVTSPAGVTGNGSMTNQDDLRQIWVAEPQDAPGKLVFTMKVDNLDPEPLPSHRWYVYFAIPGDDNNYFVALDTTQGAPRFIYGTRDSTESTIGSVPAVGGAGVFEVLGELDAASSYDSDGTIQLVIEKSVLGVETGMTLTGIAGSIRQTTNSENGVGLTVDSAGAIEGYTVVGNAVCAAAGGAGGGSTGGTAGGGTAGGNTAGGSGGGIGLLLSLPILAGVWLRRRRRT